MEDRGIIEVGKRVTVYRQGNWSWQRGVVLSIKGDIATVELDSGVTETFAKHTLKERHEQVS